MSRRMRIYDVLAEIGVPAGLLGWDYVTEAVEMVMDDPRAIQTMTKGLYPAIAERHQTTPTRVERAIRHAIERAWERGGMEIQKRWFGNSIDMRTFKPTNTEFLATVARRLSAEEEARGAKDNAVHH